MQSRKELLLIRSDAGSFLKRKPKLKYWFCNNNTFTNSEDLLSFLLLAKFYQRNEWKMRNRRIIIKSLATMLALAVISFFLFRNAVLHAAIKYLSYKVKE